MAVNLNKKEERQYNYMTVVLKYESTPGKYREGTAAQIMGKISTTIKSYNENRSSYYPAVDIWGMYVDPEEVDTDKANEMFDKYSTIAKNESEA